jgi:pyruvate/2-oxoglutarate dehydrogenase complex dihydrolipoamide acyltransferase (E2) component
MGAGTTDGNREDPAGDCTGAASAVRLPRLSEDVAEARLLRCYRAAGERVTEGEPLYECETDKVTVDVDAPFSGRLTRWLVAEGDVVATGTPMALVQADDPAPRVPEPGPERDATAEPAPDGPEPGSPLPDGPAPDAPTDAVPGERDTPAEPDTPDAGAPPADLRMSPLARKHARLRGLGPRELSRIPRRGSMLTPADIDRHLAATAAPAAGPGYDDVPLSAPQVRLNRALDRSRAEVTAGTVTVALDAAALRRAAARLRAGTDVGFVSDFQALARLAALTARTHPRLRARRVGRDTLRVFHDVTLGLAVATDDADLLVAGLPRAEGGDGWRASTRRGPGGPRWTAPPRCWCRRSTTTAPCTPRPSWCPRPSAPCCSARRPGRTAGAC